MPTSTEPFLKLNIKGYMDDIESNVAQDLRNTEKTGVAFTVPAPPTPPKDTQQQSTINQQRAETKWGRIEQAAVRDMLYEDVQQFARELSIILLIIFSGFQSVVPTGTLAITLGVSVVVITLLLALCCLWKMWGLYHLVECEVSFILWLKWASPFSTDLQTTVTGAILLIEMFAIGAVLAKCVENSNVEWMVE